MSKAKAIPEPGAQPIVLPPDLKDEIRQFVIDLRSDLESSSEQPFQFGLGAFFGNDQDGYISLSGNVNKQYNLLLNHLFDFLCGSGRFSQSAVQKLFNNAILATLDIGSRQSCERNADLLISRTFEKLNQSLAGGFRQYQVFYPIGGLAMNGLPFTFGKIEFFLLDDQFLNGINSIFHEQVREHKVVFTPYASIFVETYDTDIARQMAREIIGAHLDIINFYNDLVPYSTGQFLYLPGEANSTTVVSFTRENAPRVSENVGICFNVAGPFEISLPLIVNSSQKYHTGFMRVIDLLKKDRSEYEEKLLLALRWAGKASVSFVQGHKADAVIKFVIALETILLRRRSKQKTQKLCSRAAALLATNGTDPKSVYDEFITLYDNRGDMVHAGFIDNVSDASLEKLRYITKSCLLTLLEGEPFCKMTQDNELNDWFNNSKVIRTLTMS